MYKTSWSLSVYRVFISSASFINMTNSCQQVFTPLKLTDRKGMVLEEKCKETIALCHHVL